MDNSSLRTGTLGTDCWLHDREREWDVDCRIFHGRHTWYFSYMGRPEQIEAHQRETQDRKNQRRREQDEREMEEMMEKAKKSDLAGEDTNGSEEPEVDWVTPNASGW
jgi:hypothetical protein